MATPRVMRFDAEGRPLEFSVWLLRTRRLLESQRADLTAWKSRDAAACIALSSLLLEYEKAHFTQVRMASDYRGAYTDAQLALLPPPMAITIYFIATSLPDRLASVCDALLLKHPSELTTKVLESALKDVESNLRSVASASGAVPPPLFHGCTVPQLPTFTASLATAATDVTAAAVTTSSRSRGRSGRRGGHGAGEGGGGGVVSGGGGSTEVGGATRAAASDSPAAVGGGDAQVRQAPAGPPAAGAGVAAWYLTQRQQQQQPLLSQQEQHQQRQQQSLGQGSRPRQPSRNAVHPPCTYLVQTGARRGLPCGRTHPPGTPHAMYAVVDSSASDSVYSSVVSLGASVAKVPIASLGTCVDTSLGAAPEDTSLSFTMDSGASHCFFRDHTMLTPLPTPVSVALADPTSGPVTARYTTTLLCPAVPSGFLTSFHVPSFSRNLVGVRPLVSSYVGVRLSLLVRLRAAAAAAAAAATTAVATAPDHFAASCSSLSLAHPTVLWQHRLGHPSIPRLRAMSSQRLVLGLPRVLPSLPPSLAPPCISCVEGRPRATPHSSLRPVTEPFETLHLDVWGPTARPGSERESFFLVVVDDYSRYTKVFPLAKKFQVTSTLIQWLLTIADTRGRRVSCLHYDCGGEFCSGVLAGFCRKQGIRHLWTGSPGVASRFRVWGCLALVRDTSADKISPRAIPCVFLCFPEDSDFTFYHPPLHRFFDSRDVPPPRAPLVQPPPTGPAPLGVSHATPPPSVAPQVQPPSPQSSSQPTADPAGAGVRGEDAGGASSSGVGVGAESVFVRGPGSGGAGVEAEPVPARASSPRGAGVSRAVLGGATTEGAVLGLPAPQTLLLPPTPTKPGTRPVFVMHVRSSWIWSERREIWSGSSSSRRSSCSSSHSSSRCSRSSSISYSKSNCSDSRHSRISSSYHHLLPSLVFGPSVSPLLLLPPPPLPL
ncbi:unnamed protein product, partial [Closterium sp. NIES-53]